MKWRLRIGKNKMNNNYAEKNLMRRNLWQQIVRESAEQYKTKLQQDKIKLKQDFDLMVGDRKNR